MKLPVEHVSVNFFHSHKILLDRIDIDNYLEKIDPYINDVTKCTFNEDNINHVTLSGIGWPDGPGPGAE